MRLVNGIYSEGALSAVGAAYPAQVLLLLLGCYVRYAVLQPVGLRCCAAVGVSFDSRFCTLRLDRLDPSCRQFCP
eukprot:COSAG04_NODE_924_length_9380_cov_8.463312_4_plen_75_part_00